MSTLVQSYPFGEQLSLEVTPDDSLAFIGEGASIRILDLNATPATQKLDQVLIPDCQPLALHYYLYPPTQEHWLFIAGGTEGLWKLQLCSSLFPSSGGTPAACAANWWNNPPANPNQIDLVHGTGSSQYERKHCVAVEVLEDPAGFEGPVLLALFAASSYSTHSDIGPTEIRAYAYPWTSSTLLVSQTIGGNAPPAKEEQGRCLAVDNVGLPNTVFVGMGRGGIQRADLVAGTPPTITLSPLPAVPDAPPSFISDLCAVHLPQGNKTFLYAAVAYAGTAVPQARGVAEYKYEPPTVQPTSVQMTYAGCGHPARVSAVIEGDGQVRVALAETANAISYSESIAPVSPNGYWDGPCFSAGVWDSDVLNISIAGDCHGLSDAIQFFDRDLATSPTALTPEMSMTTTMFGDWGTLLLRSLPSTMRLYACSSGTATAVYNLTWGQALPAPAITYVGFGLPAQKGEFSTINPEIMRFAAEAPGQLGSGTMAHIDLTMPYAITPILDLGICPGGIPPPTCSFNSCKLQPPNPFGAALLGDAHWPDPMDPTHKEMFFSGAHTVRRVYDPGMSMPCDCSHQVLLDDCTSPSGPGPWNPCGLTPTVYWAPSPLPSVIAANLDFRVGWELVRLTLPATGSTSGPAMDMHWRQLAAPRGSLDNAGSDDYVSAILDDRTYFDAVTGYTYPTAVYGLRGGSDAGVKVSRPQALPSDTDPACSVSSDVGGFGEEIDPLPLVQAVTHRELVDSTGCSLGVACNGLHGARQLYNNQGELFKVRTPAGTTHRALAVAAGFPDAQQSSDPLAPPCDWASLDGLPMLVIFQVTDTGAPSGAPPTVGPPTPQLWRIALGNGPGNAFCVRTQTYLSPEGVKTIYAFLGEGTGRLIVFDLSELQTVLPATLPYYGNNHFIISAIPDLVFPKDPYDGHPANVTDLALDKDTNFLYCALGRAGVAIVDVSDPLNPVLIEILDTPGLALGVTIRKLPNGDKQLVVGDSRCGIRVYHE